ncbi:MAG TPA: mechanosensitive ion channel domain-containing protein [Anaerolineae bacterium]|nr:mechanosensitive ion channel domain-containing protein [Anaerolineae bacterium]
MDQTTQILWEQWQTLLILLARPIVQRQIWGIGIVLSLNVLLFLRLDRFLMRMDWRERPILKTQAGSASWGDIIETSLPPVVSLIGCWGIIIFFVGQGWPVGLLENGLSLFWGWLGYSLFVLGLYTVFGSPVRPYQQRILTPLFIGIVAWRLLDSFFDLRLVSNIVVFRLADEGVLIGEMILAGFVFYIFLLLAWMAETGLKHTLMRRTKADPGVIFSVTVISRYTIVALGCLLALQGVGLDLSTLAVIGGGLSIGIGIGLQRIVANFISGIMLLFEQSLRPGDVIDLDGEMGIVEELNIRATVVRTQNNVEVIVPNENFVTTQVRTFTKSNRRIRLLLPVGVGYGEDPKEVRRVLVETAGRHGLVLKDPEPNLLFRGFGDSSLDFELTVWIDQPENMLRMKSDLYYMMFEALKQNGIEIPFPQRDIHIRTDGGKTAPDGGED